MSKHKIIRVTQTVDYIVEMIDNDRPTINGWEMNQVINDWFINPNCPLSTYHATRDGHRIGNSEKVLNIEVMDIDDAVASV